MGPKSYPAFLTNGKAKGQFQEFPQILWNTLYCHIFGAESHTMMWHLQKTNISHEHRLQNDRN